MKLIHNEDLEDGDNVTRKPGPFCWGLMRGSSFGPDDPRGWYFVLRIWIPHGNLFVVGRFRLGSSGKLSYGIRLLKHPEKDYLKWM